MNFSQRRAIFDLLQKQRRSAPLLEGWTRCCYDYAQPFLDRLHDRGSAGIDEAWGTV
jgi:hypothetical protein